MFFAAFLAAVLITNLAYLKLVEPKKLIQKREVAYQQFLKERGDQELDLAFFGDSHPDGDVEVSFIDNAYLFAQGGESYVETYYKLKKILDVDKVKIKNLVLQLDLHTFSIKPKSKDKLFQQLYFYSKFVDLRDIAKMKDEPLFSLFLQRNIMFLGKGKEFLTNALISSGAIEAFGSPKELTKNAKIAYFDQFGTNPTIEFSDVVFNHFLDVLRLANEKGINVIFVKYPVSRQYELETEKNGLDKKGYYDKVFAKVDEVLDDYNVFDAYGMFFDNAEYWFDAEHLNVAGAEALSRKLNEGLVRR